MRESLLAKIEEALGGTCTLTPPHRLDVGTSGVVVLSKTHRFSSFFQKRVLANKSSSDDHLPSLTKTYRCLVSTPPPALGRLVHHVLLGQGAKGEPQHTLCFDQPLLGTGGEELTHRAELIVLSMKEIKFKGDPALEIEIQLITGRTHQIRAQMAAIGCPLIGDDLYSVVARRRLMGSEASSSDDFRRMQDDPLRPFALQSFRLEINVDPEDTDSMELLGASRLVFEAGSPWWRESG